MATGHRNQASLSRGWGLTAQEPARQEFGSSGHKTGAAEGSPGRQCSTTQSGPALQTRRDENAGDGLCGGAGSPRVPTGPPEGSLDCKHGALIKWLFFSSVRQRAQPGGPWEEGVVLGLAPAVNSYYADQRSCVRLITELKNEGSARLLPTIGINLELR